MVYKMVCYTLLYQVFGRPCAIVEMILLLRLQAACPRTVEPWVLLFRFQDKRTLSCLVLVWFSTMESTFTYTPEYMRR